MIFLRAVDVKLTRRQSAVKLLSGYILILAVLSNLFFSFFYFEICQ